MVTQVGALRVTVGANISPLQTGMKRAERQVAQSAGIMQRAVKGVNTSLSGLGSIAGVTLGGAGLLAGASAFLKIADAAKSLQAQLKLATAEFGSLERANKDVRAIAESTRSDLLATAELYAALQRNSGQLGTTQEQVARATQTVAEAFKISGAATNEQTAATRQLIQAFQSGVLRGDEFNSVMENAPRLAKLLADSLGVTVGQLRAMAQEGELTSDKLVRAFTDKKFTAGLDAEFKQLPVTFDEAMGQVYNAAIIVFSAFDRGGQFSNSLANFVSDGTEGFTKLEERAYSFGQQVGDLVTVFEVVRDALGSLQSDGVLGFGSLADSTLSWRDALYEVLVGIDAVANGLYKIATAPSRGIGGLFGKGSFGELFGAAPLAQSPVNLAGEFARRTDQQELKRRFDAARAASREAANAGRVPPPFRAPAGKAKNAGKGKQPPRDKSEDVTFQFEQELRRAQADVLRAQQSLAVTSEDRARIALELLDADRQMQQAELDDRVRRAERDFAEKKITAGALEQVKTQAAALTARYDEAHALERRAITEDLAAKKAQDAADLIDSGHDIRIELLQLEGSLAETAAERRDVELRILAAMKEQEKARLEAVLADKQSSELAKQQAQQRLNELNNIYAGREAAAIQGTRGPMESFQAEFGDISEELENLKVNGIMGAVDALTELTNGWDAFKQAGLQAIQAVLQELIRLQLMKMAVSLIGGSTGGFDAAGFSSIVSGNSAALGAIPMNIPGFAKGGTMRLGGLPGIDRNMLSLNGLPIARVSHGEWLDISNDNGSGGGDMNINVALPQGMTQREGRATGWAIGRGARERMGAAARGRSR